MGHCPYCQTKLRTGKYERHVSQFCLKRPMKCNVCQWKYPYDIYVEQHEKLCDMLSVQCKYCKFDTTNRHICEHLYKCEGLNKLLFDKYKITCEEEIGIVSLLETIFRHRRKRYLMANYIGARKDQHNMIIRMYYYAAHFHWSFLVDRKQVQYFSQSDVVLYKHFPVRLIPDLKYMMGDTLTESVITYMYYLHNIEYKWTKDKYFGKESFDITSIFTGEMCHQFTNNRDRMKAYFASVGELLDICKMNIYMNKIIMEMLYL